MRREDLTRVRVADLMQATFGIIAGKNGETIVFSVTAMMREACLAYVAARKEAGLSESRYALCSEEGTQLHRRTSSADTEQAFEAAGFDKAQRTHALRYTAATRLLETGFSYHWIQELTGHRMAEMAKKYTEKKRLAPVIGQTFDKLDGMAADQGKLIEAGGDEVLTSRSAARVDEMIKAILGLLVMFGYSAGGRPSGRDGQRWDRAGAQRRQAKAAVGRGKDSSAAAEPGSEAYRSS